MMKFIMSCWAAGNMSKCLFLFVLYMMTSCFLLYKKNKWMKERKKHGLEMPVGRCHDDYRYELYGKCPKIIYKKVADKMSYANSIDPDQGLCCLPFHSVF